MGESTINPTPGNEIRRLREERHLRPVDVQRISDAVKRQMNCADFGISHATLNDIENEHSVPNVRKMFSLAVCFRLPMESILALYGAPPEGVRQYLDDPGQQRSLGDLAFPGADPSFVLQFDMAFDSRRTAPLATDVAQWPKFPWVLRDRMSPSNYSYAWVGTEDDAMADLILGGSLIEIDRSQCAVEIAAWSELRERPIYFCWTKDGYCCGWCEEDSEELVILPHPASHAQTRRYRRPREAAIIGRVTYAWVPFGASKVNSAPTRVLSAH